MDWTDIEAKLKDQAEEVCRYLLPAGHRDGMEWVVGDLAGNAGYSTKINIGGKAGLWRDFAGEGGGKTLLSLWMHVRKFEKFGQAVQEAKKFLNIADNFQQRVRPHPSPTPAPDDSAWRAVAEAWVKCEPLTEDGPVWKYLVQDRKLDPNCLLACDVREYLSHGQWAMVFPYYNAQPVDEIAVTLPGESKCPDWLKFELVDRPGGKKREWTTKQPDKTLFGIPLSEHPFFKRARHVLICEGEKDALTWITYGCNEWDILPVSVPFGAKWKGQDKSRPSPNREWLDRSWDWLQGYETIFIAMDGDDAGRRAAADIIAEIGPRRCRLVTLPDGKKDANDCLKADVSRDAMKTALDQALDFSPEKVLNASELEKEFMEEWFEKHTEEGLDLPVDFKFKVRMGEMTIWTGIEKSGKTTFLSFAMNALMAQGERALITGFETLTVKNLKKLSRQAYGGLIYDKRILEKCKTDEERATYRAVQEEAALETLRWLGKTLWMYDHVGIVPWRQVLDDFRWARRRHGITQFVVDNFMRLGIAKDDYAQQADAIIAFAKLAMDLNVHVHVVVHQNKSEGNRGGASGKRSVSGAYEIIANAHNIIEVQRDEKKGEQVSDLFDQLDIGKITAIDFQKEKAQLDMVPDGKVVLHAQRDGEVQNGSKYLWFLWESQQYVDKPSSHADHRPLRFVDHAKRMATQNDLPTTEEILKNQNQ